MRSSSCRRGASAAAWSTRELARVRATGRMLRRFVRFLRGAYRVIVREYADACAFACEHACALARIGTWTSAPCVD